MSDIERPQHQPGCMCFICEGKVDHLLPQPDAINHPAHYGGDTTYEAIKVIEAWGLNFSLGNVIKYVARAGRKRSEDPAADLEKAKWYLEREIERWRR